MNENLPQSTLSFTALAESIAASGLVPPEDLAPLLSSAAGSPTALEASVIARGLLTRFQLAALSEGRGASLRIGNYDLLDRLGAGGMGTVYKARHRRMKREVALKVLAANLSDNPVFVKRFQREVETIACLGHPNVVMAYDADEAEVGHFLVMEFVNGRDLAACLEQSGPFTLARAVDCTLQAARGLAYAHQQGIVHRDIKPHNLLLDDHGVVKVTDLGLARLNHGAAGPAEGTDVTMAGGVIGTADYMPPEQAVDSTTIDHRADIYSLGCTLHFLLTGKPPYCGATFISILLKHRDAEIPSLCAVRPEVPPRLDALFRRMLAKQPEQRPQLMSEVVQELEAIASTLPRDDSGAGHTVELTSGSETLSFSTLPTSELQERALALDRAASSTTVLVVEPSRVQASIIKNYLNDLSFSAVGTAASGSDAIELIRKHSPRAVVSAMYLSDIDGLKLAEQIRAEFKANAPGFVLITSEEVDGQPAALGELNRVLLLAKPFTQQQLREALNQVTGASMELAPATGVTGATGVAGVAGVGLRTGGKADRSGLRVMIVDDSSTARIHMRSVLQGLGFRRFLEVPDGAHAIAVAARENCDLIVTDYNMPLMDGRALVSYLKQNQATAKIPILMVTTETEPQVLDAVRRLGVVAIIDKAFSASVVGPLVDALF